MDGESSEALDTVQNDIMIVKKTWRRKEEFRNRAWKLKHLAKEVELAPATRSISNIALPTGSRR